MTINDLQEIIFEGTKIWASQLDNNPDLIKLDRDIELLNHTFQGLDFGYQKQLVSSLRSSLPKEVLEHIYTELGKQFRIDNWKLPETPEEVI